MLTDEFSVYTDVNHLGVLIGNLVTDRIVALSTSAVFNDKSLIQNYWGMDDGEIDSGFQGHLYTRPNDILVVQLPAVNDGIIQMVTTAIRVNDEIWNSFTGIRLASPASRIVLASGRHAQPAPYLPDNFSLYEGRLLDAAAFWHRATGASLLIFVLNSQIADKLGLSFRNKENLVDEIRTTSLLMDKNTAMKILQENEVECAKTFTFSEIISPEHILCAGITSSSGRYVFKPSGGAAGIGVFSNTGLGASLQQIEKHLNMLIEKDLLPNRYQIQEFLPGISYGASAYFNREGKFEILEIHQQIINDTSKFIGGRWTPAIEAEQMECTYKLYWQMADIESLSLFGLICLDIINGKIIEVNPRVTAAAPIAHILKLKDQIASHLDSDFQIHQIDLKTNVTVTYESIRNGTLQRLIEDIWNDCGVLILPQGLNPFGYSRIIFINDDFNGSAGKMFIQAIR